MYKNTAYPNRVGQTYPDAVPPSRDVQRQEDEAGEGNVKMREAVRQMFGNYVLDDLLEQPTPRLFSSHVFGKRLLPQGIFGDEGGNAGRGRLIVVVRNLKDSLVGLCFCVLPLFDMGRAPLVSLGRATVEANAPVFFSLLFVEIAPMEPSAGLQPSLSW